MLVIAILLLLPAAIQQAAGTQANQYYANRLLDVVSTPQLAPGGRGTLELAVSNPFNTTLDNLTLVLSVYAFSTGGGEVQLSSIPVSERPAIGGSGTSTQLLVPIMLPQTSVYFNITVSTTASTRHGDFFNPGTYFVSTYASFTASGQQIKMGSRGVFTAAEWSSILVQSSGGNYLNYTYLNGTLGYQGILPDTSFTVSTPSPVYLLWVAAGLSAFFAAAAFFVYRRGQLRGGRQSR